MATKYHNAEWVRQQKWINDSYEKVCNEEWSSATPLSKLSWRDDDLVAPLPPVAPRAPPSFNADHAWDMVVLAARASRYG